MATIDTDVQVSKRVLWIGSDAYPLQNIARAQVRTFQPIPGTPVKDFIKNILKWAAIAVVIAIALAALGQSKLINDIFILLLLIVLVCVLNLVRAIKRERRKKPYYLLVLQTSGDPRTLLASTDQNVIYDLVRTIMAAIDDATVTYQKLIANYYGDIISQYGNENIGKMLT
jgi:hypothetical protein